jgi:hypothetical protein
MSRKLSIALTGLILFLTTNLSVPVLAATRQVMEYSQGGYHVLFLPAIILIMYVLLSGVVSIAYLVWAYNNNKWPFW